MYEIYIDTTTRYEKKVILKKDGVELAKAEGDLDIVVEIQNLLTKYKLSPKDIDKYNVNKGPGSFTGLKVGVTIANVFNWALGKKSIAELDLPKYGKEPNIG